MAKNKSKTFEYGEVYRDPKTWVLHHENSNTGMVERELLGKAAQHRLIVFNKLSLLGWHLFAQCGRTYYVFRQRKFEGWCR